MATSSRLDDRAQINDLLVRYCTGIDRGAWDLFRSVFVPEVRADYGSIGQWHSVEEITAYMTDTHLGMARTLHNLTNVAIEFDPEDQARAQCRSYVCVVLVAGESGRSTRATGHYDDHLVQDADGWRIARRTFTLISLEALRTIEL